MSTKSDIEWTDATWNPVVGCAKVSAGCKHCYAETMAARHVLMSRAQGRTSPYLPVVDVHERKNPQTGKTEWVRRWNGRAVCLPERLTEPLSWRKPRRVFVNSMSDLFHEDVPFEFVAAVFGVMAASKRHAFQVLTKRPERMLEFFAWLDGQVGGVADGCVRRCLVELDQAIDRPFHLDYPRWPLPNVWLGVSVENRAALARLDALRQAPAVVRFVSFEPLLEDLGTVDLRGIHWAIPGGESGPGARPLVVDWIRSLLEQCLAAGVAPFVKQFGAVVLDRNDAGFDGDDGDWPGGTVVQQQRERHQGALVRVRLKDRKGGDPDEWPAGLRVRQLPEVRHAG